MSEIETLYHHICREYMSLMSQKYDIDVTMSLDEYMTEYQEIMTRQERTFGNELVDLYMTVS